jgi:tight adherence protein B
MSADQTPIIFSILVFLTLFSLFATFLVFQGGHTRNERSRLNARLKKESARYQPSEKSHIHLLRQRYRTNLNWLDLWVLRIPNFQYVLRKGDLRNGIRKIQGAFLACFILALLVSRSITSLVPHPIATWLIAAIICFMPYFYISLAAKKRINEFEKQLPEALDAITRALKAGYTFNDTMSLVANEMDEPLGEEFRWVCDEINAGFEIRAALLNLLERVPSVSLMAFTTTVLLQRETGGNLSETLGKIAQIIRKRFTFQRTIKTLTAEARMSAWILGLLPFTVFLIIYMINPDYVMLLINQSVGNKLIMIGLLLMMAGAVWLRAIINIEI